MTQKAPHSTHHTLTYPLVAEVMITKTRKRRTKKDATPPRPLILIASKTRASAKAKKSWRLKTKFTGRRQMRERNKQRWGMAPMAGNTKLLRGVAMV